MTLKIGVVGLPGKWSTEQLADALEKRTGFRMVIDLERVYFDLHAGEVHFGATNLADLDGLVIKKLGREYAPYLLERLEGLRFLNETRGVRIFSKPSSIARMISRLSCTSVLRMGGIPMPATVITEDRDSAEKVIHSFGRAVLKPLFTSKSRGMRLVDRGSDVGGTVAAFQQDGNRVMYIQKIVEHSGRDLGVCFLGGHYIGTYARVGKEGSWNTTTYSGGRYEAFTPGNSIIALAHRAQALFDLDFTCVDVVETVEGAEVFEVSAFGGFRGLSEANGMDVASLYAEHVIGELENDQ